MEDRHRGILRKTRTLFVRDMQCIPEVVDLLFEFDIFTESMKNEILSVSARESQVRKILDILVRRGSTAFDYFHQVLVDTRQQFLADILKPELAAQQHPAYDSIASNKRALLKKTKTVDQGILEYKTQRSIEEHRQNQTVVYPVLPSGGETSHQPPGFTQQGQCPSLSASFSGARNNYLPSNSYMGSVISQPEDSKVVTQPEDEDEDTLPTEWPSLEDHARPAHVEVKHFNLFNAQCRSLLGQDNHYTMTGVPRGRLLIINNSTFEPSTKLPKILTADADGTSIDLLFKGLHFKKTMKRNVSGQKILELLEKERQHDHTPYQCFALVIMSHGLGKTIYGSDGAEINLQTILNQFSNTNCPTLAGKPKCFFIQACHCAKPYDVKIEDSSPTSDFDSLGTDLEELVGSISVNCSQPDKTDMFVARAISTESHLWNQEERGKKFIQALVYVFKKLAYIDDLETLITKVNTLVSGGGTSKQIVEFSSSLQKKLYFFPGFPDESQIQHRSS